MKRIWTSLLLLLLVGLALFLPSIHNHFVMDDEEQIVSNTVIKDLARWPEWFVGSTFNSGGGMKMVAGFYRPLMSAVFALSWAIGGGNPWPFHIIQIFLHIANSILVFLLLTRFIRRKLVSLFLALLFLVHPVNGENVVYISNVQEPLCFFFGMLAVLWVTGEGRKPAWTTVLGAGFLLLLSLLSKETGILFAMFILWHLVLLGTRSGITRWLIVVAGVLAIYAYLRFGLTNIPFWFRWHTPVPIMNAPLTTRLMNIPAILLYYLSHAVYPAQLVISHQWLVTETTWRDFWFPLAVDGVVALLVAWSARSVWQKKRSSIRPYLFFLGWFLGGLAIHLQIVALDAPAADRWLYIPLVGALGMIGFTVPNQLWKKLWIRGAVIVILAALFLRSAVRIQNWKDGLTLYTHDLTITPTNADLENNLGLELVRLGRTDEAKVHFENAAHREPHMFVSWNNLGWVYEQGGFLKEAEFYYKRSIDNGTYYLAMQNYARILYLQGKYDEAQQFIETFALKHFPHNKVLLEIDEALRSR